MYIFLQAMRNVNNQFSDINITERMFTSEITEDDYDMVKEFIQMNSDVREEPLTDHITNNLITNKLASYRQQVDDDLVMNTVFRIKEVELED